MSANPILPGFYPDPSICRVGGDHYLVTSSFEYFPGVPVFHSRDLTRWEQIGHALDRAEQLTVSTGLAAASTGIYAPTLRWHGGEFWLVTTNIAEVMKGHLIVRSTDPASGWTNPVHTGGAVGIDPDLAWDEDGTCYLTWAAPGRGIAQATVDPVSGRVLSEPRALWSGTGLAHPEGPHLFTRNGWWYLLIAEGGTERAHVVSIARSRAPGGPFEGHPANPILSHRSTSHAVQNIGHADVVELADGSWAMVHLGVRPRGVSPGFHVNGRETFLAGVDWVDDWPVVVEDAYPVAPAATSFIDEFRDPALHPRWISPGVDPRSFVHHDGAGVTMAAGREPSGREARRLLAVRPRDAAWQADATIPVGDACLVVRVDDAHWAAVERVGETLSVRMVVGPLDQTLASVTGVGADRPLAVRAVDLPDQYSRTGPDRLELGFREGAELHVVAAVDGRYLSTEVAGGFTGRVVGVEALGTGARLTRFAYAALGTRRPAVPATAPPRP